MANIKDIIFNTISKATGITRDIEFKPILKLNDTLRSINFKPMLISRFYTVALNVLDTVIKSINNTIKITILDAAKFYTAYINVFDNVNLYDVLISVIGTPLYATYSVYVAVMESVAETYTVTVTVYNKEDCTSEFIELNC